MRSAALPLKISEILSIYQMIARYSVKLDYRN
jgi:hypothetical protein